ncbi:MAG: hypothetical protein AAB691_01840, partial [Patescibacteria group bacterium]
MIVTVKNFFRPNRKRILLAAIILAILPFPVIFGVLPFGFYIMAAISVSLLLDLLLSILLHPILSFSNPQAILASIKDASSFFIGFYGLLFVVYTVASYAVSCLIIKPTP